jgi:hypothetical protein
MMTQQGAGPRWCTEVLGSSSWGPHGCRVGSSHHRRTSTTSSASGCRRLTPGLSGGPAPARYRTKRRCRRCHPFHRSRDSPPGSGSRGTSTPGWDPTKRQGHCERPSKPKPQTRHHRAPGHRGNPPQSIQHRSARTTRHRKHTSPPPSVYGPPSSDTANLFFHLVSSRYKHAALILTSNLPFGRWDDVFGDQVVALAIIDSTATLVSQTWEGRIRGRTILHPHS